jgi:hypothetical protein
MKQGVHGDKLTALYDSAKLPKVDKPRIKCAIEKYHEWIDRMDAVDFDDPLETTKTLVGYLNDYKYYIDVSLIFDSPEDFLYRQKGQLKLDNTIVEEFIPVLVAKCLKGKIHDPSLTITSQSKVFSSAFFHSNIIDGGQGGGFTIKSKDQDFSICRHLYIKTSYSNSFPSNDTLVLETNLGYITAEIKTNLDKTMFQEASATAHNVKEAVTGAKYFLLCDWLDMTPISSETTDIEEIIILRKGRRIGAGIRDLFSTRSGRDLMHDTYVNFLKEHPYDYLMFYEFIQHILKTISNCELDETEVLKLGHS